MFDLFEAFLGVVDVVNVKIVPFYFNKCLL